MDTLARIFAVVALALAVPRIAVLMFRVRRRIVGVSDVRVELFALAATTAGAMALFASPGGVISWVLVLLGLVLAGWSIKFGRTVSLTKEAGGNSR